MIARFRTWLRRWLGVADVLAPVIPDHTPGLKIDPSAFAYFGSQPVISRKVEPPKLFPGVVPADRVLAADDKIACGPEYLAFDNELMAPIWAWAREVNCGLGFPGYAFLSELTQRSEYRSPSETLAGEMTREWITLITKGKAGEGDDSDNKQADDAAPPPPSPAAKKPDAVDDDEDGDNEELSGAEDKIEDIVEALDKFGVREAFYRLAEQDGFFGRSQLFIDLDQGGKDPDVVRKLPLVIGPETIKKGSLKGFRVVEPIWSTPYYYNAQDPTAEDFYKPKAWYVLGKLTHASRLLTFVSREVPDLLKPAYNFGGLSLTQLMEPYVFQWLRTRNSVSDLIHNFSIITLATNMLQALQGDPAATKSLFDRAKLFTQSRDNQGIMLLDKDTEELAQVAVPLSGLDSLQAQSQEHMAAPSHIPLVKLLGITPTGLNASDKGEIQVFYDYIRALQQKLFYKHLKTVIGIIQLHLFGAIDDAITFEFVPLTSPTVKELSEIRKSDADAGVAYVDRGVVSPDEERERLIADPNSGYKNLSGPAPEPPTPDFPPGMEGGEPGEGGAPPFGNAPKKDDVGGIARGRAVVVS